MKKLVVAAFAGSVAVLAACSSAPARDGVKVVRYDVRSRFVHRTLAQTAVLPPGGGAGRPLLVFLHGRGQAGNESNANGAFYAALRSLGSRAPVVVFPNGGDHSYFHARRSGDWSRYVLDEVIPRAAERFGADPDRVAIGGISMGGFGAFAIARKRPSRFCAVGGHSAAFWQSSGDTAPGRSTTRRTSPATTSSASPARAAARRGATPACGSTAAPPTRSARPTSGSPRRCPSACATGRAATTPTTGALTTSATSASTPARWRTAPERRNEPAQPSRRLRETDADAADPV